MVVYGDILIAENFIMGGALLYITGQIFGESFFGVKKKCRFFVGACMCGFFSLVIFLPVKIPFTVLMEICFALIVSFTVFGRQRAWQKALIFVLTTYFMGGIIMALLLATDNTGLYTAAGIYTGDMKAGALAGFTALALFTSKKCIAVVKEKKFYREHVYDVTISVGKKVLETKGFLDTGNGLFEPISGRPAAVAGEALWQRIGKIGMMQENRFCAIPYYAVGGTGILVGIRTDYMEVAGARISDCIIAKSDENFCVKVDNTHDCELLLSKEMVKANF